MLRSDVDHEAEGNPRTGHTRLPGVIQRNPGEEKFSTIQIPNPGLQKARNCIYCILPELVWERDEVRESLVDAPHEVDTGEYVFCWPA